MSFFKTLILVPIWSYMGKIIVDELKKQFLLYKNFNFYTVNFFYYSPMNDGEFINYNG